MTSDLRSLPFPLRFVACTALLFNLSGGHADAALAEEPSLWFEHAAALPDHPINGVEWSEWHHNRQVTIGAIFKYSWMYEYYPTPRQLTIDGLFGCYLTLLSSSNGVRSSNNTSLAPFDVFAIGHSYKTSIPFVYEETDKAFGTITVSHKRNLLTAYKVTIHGIDLSSTSLQEPASELWLSAKIISRNVILPARGTGNIYISPSDHIQVTYLTFEAAIDPEPTTPKSGG